MLLEAIGISQRTTTSWIRAMMVPQGALGSDRVGLTPRPSVEQLRRRRRFRRLIGVVPMAAVVASGSVMIDRLVTPTHSEVVAKEAARRYGSSPGARQVSRPPIPALAQPPDGFGCTSVADKSQYWVVRGTLNSLVAFLQKHPPTGMTWPGNDSALTYIAYGPANQGPPPSTLQLEVSFGAIDSASVGIRADRIAIPSSASCIYHGTSVGS
jgi:hypothetical protein